MKSIEISTQEQGIPFQASSKTKNIYKSFLKEYASKSLGYASIGIICSSCLGSIAVMLILMNQNLPKLNMVLELMLVTILCMIFNGTVLSQQPSKVQFNTLIASITGSLLIIIVSFI